MAGFVLTIAALVTVAVALDFALLHTPRVVQGAAMLAQEAMRAVRRRRGRA